MARVPFRPCLFGKNAKDINSETVVNPWDEA